MAAHRAFVLRWIWSGQDRHAADLAEVGFLADCSPQQRQRIASLSATLDVGAGRRLCRAGGSDRQFLVIVDGEATVTSGGAEVATLGPGCGFGAVPVLTPEGRRGAAVTAATPMTLLVLHRGEFDTLAEDVPVIVRHVQDETASRLSQATANTRQPAPRRHSLSRQTRDTEGRGKGTLVMEVLACLGRTGAWRRRTAGRTR